jgi:hypothetical protein
MSKKIKSCFILLIIPLVSLYSNINFFDNTKTNIGTVHSAIWSPFQNSSTLANVENIEAGVLYRNSFLLKELSTKTVQLAIPTSLINIGVIYSHFGYSLYNESIAGLSFARRFSEKWSLGVSIDYYSAMMSKTDGHKGNIIAQVGLLIQPLKNLYIGFQVFNPVQTKIKSSSFLKNIPSVFSLGGSYWFSEKILLGVQVEKEIQSKILVSAGFEYLLIKNFLIKVSCRKQEYLVPGMGFGIKLKSFGIDTNFELHPILGLNSGIALTYKFERK